MGENFSIEGRRNAKEMKVKAKVKAGREKPGGLNSRQWTTRSQSRRRRREPAFGSVGGRRWREQRIAERNPK